MTRILVLLFLLSSVLAEDVYLKDGGFFKNVEIFKEMDQGIVLIYEKAHVQVLTENLLRIERTPYDPSVISTTNTEFNRGGLVVGDKTRISGQSAKMSFNKSMIPIALLSLFWSYQSFSAIDDYEGLEDMQKELRRDGIVYLAIGALSVGLSLEFNNVDLPPDSVTVVNKQGRD